MYKPWAVVVAVAVQPSQTWRIGFGYLLPLLLHSSEAVDSYIRVNRGDEGAVAAQEKISCSASQPASRVLMQRGFAPVPGIDNVGDLDVQGDAPLLAPGFGFDSASVGQLDEDSELLPISRQQQRFKERVPLLQRASWVPREREDASPAVQSWETEPSFADDNSMLLPLEDDDGIADRSGRVIENVWNLLQQAPNETTNATDVEVTVVNTTPQEEVVNTTVVNTVGNATEEPENTTNITAEVPAGSAKMPVKNQTKFKVGDVVVIQDPEGNVETNEIIAIGQPNETNETDGLTDVTDTLIGSLSLMSSLNATLNTTSVNATAADVGGQMLIFKYPTKKSLRPGANVTRLDVNNSQVKQLPKDHCADIPGGYYKDDQGHNCTDWNGYDCNNAALNWGYTEQGQQALLENCRLTCGLCQEEQPGVVEAPDGQYDLRASDFGDGVDEAYHIVDEALSKWKTLYESDIGIMRWVAYIVFVPIYWALMLLVGRFYIDVKHHPPPKDPNSETQHGMWYHGLLSCYEVPGLSLFTFCCAPVRWADTIRMAGFTGFWIALCLWLGAESLWWLIVPFPAYVATVIALGVYARQKMRKQFEMPFCTPVTVFADILFHTCCQCCALVQEARQYEYAWACHDPAVTKGKGSS